MVCQSRTHRSSQVDRIEPKPGNHCIFHEIQIPGDLCTVFTGTSTNDRQKSSRGMRNVAPIHQTETGKSSIFTKINRIRPKLTSYEIGSHRSTKNRQKSFAHMQFKARGARYRVTLLNEQNLSKIQERYSPRGYLSLTIISRICEIENKTPGRAKRVGFGTSRRSHVSILGSRDRGFSEYEKSKISLRGTEKVDQIYQNYSLKIRN